MNFITPTDDGISINLPLNDLQLELFAVFLILVALTFAAMALPKVARTLPRLHDGTMANIGLWLGLLLAGCFAAVALYEFVSVVFRIPPYDVNTDHAAAIRNIGLFTAAVFGAPFIAWRAIVAAKQVEVAEQSHITDQLAKAVELIGADKTTKGPNGEKTVPNLEVRIGGLIALERIAQDSQRDHIQIMEILCAYIRENAKIGAIPSLSKSELSSFSITDWVTRRRETPKRELGEDILFAFRVISRRTEHRRQHEMSKGYRLDLRKVNLNRSSITLQNFDGALFDKAELEGMVLRDSDLKDASFISAKLNDTELYEVKLENACLVGAELNHTTISHTDLCNADLRFAKFSYANLEHTTFCSRTDVNFVNLQNASLRNLHLFASLSILNNFRNAFADATVTFDSEISPRSIYWPHHWPSTPLSINKFKLEYRAWLDDPASYTPPENTP